jgi:molybdate/tungstate transport system permease protein
MKKTEPLTWLFALLSLPLILLLTLPLLKMTFEPSLAMLLETICDKDVLAAMGRSIGTALSASFIAFVLGTPLAYLLARKKLFGKKIIEGIIDLPIMIPHPVVGIAILSLAGKNNPFGRFLSDLGIQIMGTKTGIILVLLFVGMPFYINTVKAGFENVPVRLEKASRTLGAGAFSTFLRITFPLTWRYMILGFIMSTARAISEFGAVVIVAYHPMTAPVMIYERFTAYGLKYSQPIAVWLIAISFILFIFLRLFSKSVNNYN